MIRCGLVLIETGELVRVTLGDEPVPEYDAALHDVIEVPEGWMTGDLEWDATTRAFVDVSLARAKAAAWAAVKAKRAAVQIGGCATTLGPVQTDLESRGLINGAVTMAMLALSAGAPFEMAFTLADNSTVAIDAAGMIALGQAVGAFIATAHARSVALRALIDAAGDIAAIEAIDIETGWPA